MGREDVAVVERFDWWTSVRCGKKVLVVQMDLSKLLVVTNIINGISFQSNLEIGIYVS